MILHCAFGSIKVDVIMMNYEIFPKDKALRRHLFRAGDLIHHSESRGIDHLLKLRLVLGGRCWCGAS